MRARVCNRAWRNVITTLSAVQGGCARSLVSCHHDPHPLTICRIQDAVLVRCGGAARPECRCVLARRSNFLERPLRGRGPDTLSRSRDGAYAPLVRASLAIASTADCEISADKDFGSGQSRCVALQRSQVREIINSTKRRRCRRHRKWSGAVVSSQLRAVCLLSLILKV